MKIYLPQRKECRGSLIEKVSKEGRRFDRILKIQVPSRYNELCGLQTQIPGLVEK